MKKEPDEVDFEILKNAVRLSPQGSKQHPRMRDVYRPFLGQGEGKHRDGFLWKRVTILAEEGYLKLTKLPGRHVLVKPTPKTYKLLQHNGLNSKGA